MFCEKCGASNPEDAVFCESCGNNMTASLEDPSAEVSFDEPAKKFPTKQQIIIGAAALGTFLIILIASIVGCVACGGCSGAETPIKTAFKAMEKGDFDKFMSVNPKPFQQYIAENKSKREDQKEYFEEECENIEKITYEVKKKKKLDKNDIEDLEDDINDSMEYLDDDLKEVKISEAYEFKIKVKMEIDGEEDIKDTMEIIVYKSGGKWYLGEEMF